MNKSGMITLYVLLCSLFYNGILRYRFRYRGYTNTAPIGLTNQWQEIHISLDKLKLISTAL